MPRRRCQYCRTPLKWLASLLRFSTCDHCAYRMSMGTSPSRPKEDDR